MPVTIERYWVPYKYVTTIMKCPNCNEFMQNTDEYYNKDGIVYRRVHCNCNGGTDYYVPIGMFVDDSKLDNNSAELNDTVQSFTSEEFFSND